jgi:hypothetical protein
MTTSDLIVDVEGIYTYIYTKVHVMELYMCLRTRRHVFLSAGVELGISESIYTIFG